MEENLIINSRAYKEAEREKANQALLMAKSLKRKVRRAAIGEDQFSRELKVVNKPQETENNMLSIPEVCKLLNINTHFFAARIKRHKLSYTLKGKKKYFDKEYIVDYFKKNPYRFDKKCS